MKRLIAFADESTSTELFLLICTRYPWIPNYHIKSLVSGPLSQTISNPNKATRNSKMNSLSLASTSLLNTEQTEQNISGAQPFPVQISLVYYWTTFTCKQ